MNKYKINSIALAVIKNQNADETFKSVAYSSSEDISLKTKNSGVFIATI